jgi:hypothetical protein
MDYSAIGQAVATSEDLTVERKTTREVPREGVALLRLVDYIETGRHEAKNPMHKPSLKVLLTFELSHPDHMIEMDGKKVPAKITVRVNKTYSDKGKYMPLFKALDRALGGGFKHIVQMIGKPMLGHIYHNEWEGKKFANLDIDGSWSFKPATMDDPLSGTSTPIPVPELHGTPKVFLWEAEGMTDEQVTGMWDSIFIEGTRTNEKGTEVSKNWIQETIMENIEWEGSTVQALTQEFVSLDDDGATPAADGTVPSLDD